MEVHPHDDIVRGKSVCGTTGIFGVSGTTVSPAVVPQSIDGLIGSFGITGATMGGFVIGSGEDGTMGVVMGVSGIMVTGSVVVSGVGG